MRGLRAMGVIFVAVYLLVAGLYLWPDIKARKDCRDRGGEIRLGADGIHFSCAMGGDRK